MRQVVPAFFLAVIALAVASAQTETPKQSQTDVSKPSPTYAETVKLLKGVADDQSDATKALFQLGRTRVDDLVRAEKVEPDHDLKVSAGLVLQLLGDSRCGQWSDSDSGKAKPSDNSQAAKPLSICSSKVSEPMLARLEKAFALRPCEKSQSCKEEDYPDIDDSVISALMIDGSPRTEALLTRMRELAMASNMDDIMISEVLTDISEFKTAGEMRKGIAIDDPGLVDWIQKNAFFLSEAERDGADVNVLARTPDEDRLLVEVSYRCGVKCGKGYYVVLERAGKVWHFALARLIWMS